MSACEKLEMAVSNFNCPWCFKCNLNVAEEFLSLINHRLNKGVWYEFGLLSNVVYVSILTGF